MWRRNLDYVLPWISLICLLTLSTRGATGLRGSAVVLQAKAKAAEQKEAGIEAAATADTEEGVVNGTSTNSTQQLKLKPALTGIPQKDYIFDPNLPRELNGHNLTDYPFYNAVPEDIEFPCDGLHDGFYASVPHKCQVYHHCLFGTRYDFLCANYTAFDQKTFICHFVSEVDCQNSPKYYKRNEALYKAATTSAPPTTARPSTTTTTTTTVAPPPSSPARNRWQQGAGGGQRPFRGQRRPYRRRRPVVYEYYYDGDDYDADGDYYYDDEPPERQQPRRKGNRKHQRPSHGQGFRDDDSLRDHGRPCCEPQAQQSTSTEAIKPSVRPSSQSPLAASSVYDRPRVPPKIRRPVPINERDKYEYTQQTTDVGPAPTAESTKTKKTQARKPITDDDYYDYEEDDDYAEEQQPKYKKVKTSDYEVEPAGAGDNRRPVSSRHRLRMSSHRRPDRFEDDYEEEYDRPRTRKEPKNNEEYTQRSSRFRNRGGKPYLRDEEAVPAERPGYISGSRPGSSSRRKPQNDYQRPSGRKQYERRPVYEDDDYEEYYDEDEVEDEKLSRRNHRTRVNGRREEEYADDQRNEKRPSNKGSSSNSGAKYASASRNSENTKTENNSQSKLQANSNSKTSSNNDDSKDVSQNKDAKRTTVNKPLGNDNRKSSSTTTEKYLSDEEYDEDEDYEEPKQTSSTKSVDTKFNRKEVTSKPNQAQNSWNKNSNDRINNDEPSSTSSSIETIKNQQSTALNNQEPINNYNRNSGLFRSRTSPLISQTQPVTTPMTLSHRFSSTISDDSQDYDDSEGNNRYKIDTRGKVVSTTPNSYRKQAVTSAASGDSFDETSSTNKFKSSSSISEMSTAPPSKEMTEVPTYNIPSRSSAPSAVFRRPLKSTASNTIETTTSYSDAASFSSQRPIAAIGYRRVVKPSDSDEKFIRKEQAFPPTGFSGNFRRPSKVTNSDRIALSTSDPTDEDSFRKSTPLPSVPTSAINNNSQYRKFLKPSYETSTQENSFSTRSNFEDSSKPLKQSPPATLNYRRPAPISKPVVEDYSSDYDDDQKSLPVKQPSPGLNYRRPFKTQKLQENQAAADSGQDFSDSSDTSPPTSNLYQKPIEIPTKQEGSTIINLKSHYGFLNGNRPKNVVDTPTAPEAVSYNTRLLENSNSDKTIPLSFPRQPPISYDSTAPGPSAPEESLQGNSRNNFRQNQYNEPQNPSTSFDLNIPEEEYDVTLNDALQPSTLHPTRSLADYPLQARIKSRGYQSRATHPSTSRGAASYLLPSASQQYIARVQTTGSQEKTVEPQRSQSKDSQTSADQEEYEAVVLSAPQYDTGSLHRWVSQQRQIRPTEWYW